MTEHDGLNEYLVLSRGQWDEDASPERVQQTIDDFYEWHGKLAEAGTVGAGQRLGMARRKVTQKGVTDGPFSEAKEVVGGYWFVYARDLDHAAALMAQSPCLACGLQYEIRPTDPQRCDAFAVTTETPASRQLA